MELVKLILMTVWLQSWCLQSAKVGNVTCYIVNCYIAFSSTTIIILLGWLISLDWIMQIAVKFYFPDSRFSSEPPYCCQMCLSAFLLLLFNSVLVQHHCPLFSPLKTFPILPWLWYSWTTSPLYRTRPDIQWSQQERPAPTSGRSRRFKGRSVWGFRALKWLRNCGRFSAFRCLVSWGLSWHA